MPTKPTALITGASGTLGHALVKEFVPHCSLVIVNGRDLNALQNHVMEFDTCYVCDGDLGTSGARQRILGQVKHHDCEVAVLCHGLMLSKLLLECSEEEITQVIQTNLTSTLLLIRGLWAHFKNKGSGTIVVVNSMAGKTGNPEEVAYCASKFGLRGVVESMSYEAIKHGVRIVGVYPGAFKSPATSKRLNYDYLLHPSDVARFITDLCFVHKNLRLDSVDILRTKY